VSVYELSILPEFIGYGAKCRGSFVMLYRLVLRADEFHDSACLSSATVRRRPNQFSAPAVKCLQRQFQRHRFSNRCYRCGAAATNSRLPDDAQNDELDKHLLPAWLRPPLAISRLDTDKEYILEKLQQVPVIGASFPATDDHRVEGSLQVLPIDQSVLHGHDFSGGEVVAGRQLVLLGTQHCPGKAARFVR
jgi:hypothetical protein